MMDDSHGEQNFQTTQWNLVVSSRGTDSAVRKQSLGELCQVYWYPLFAYLRRKGYGTEDAADYVQGFFYELIQKQFLDSVAPENGRFRWFLMSALKRFVSKELDKQNAQKRGGEHTLFSIDVDDAEQRYQLEPTDGWTAEKLFDRRWALEVIQQALQCLKQHQTAKGKLELYLALQSTLSVGQISQAQYEKIGAAFEMSPGAVKVAALRLRERYRKTLQEIVGQTIAESEVVDDELEQLLSALRG